jgi:exonuclease III
MIEQLSIFTWNVRGLNAPARREAVHNMIQSTNPKLVCIQETKLQVINLQIATVGTMVSSTCRLMVLEGVLCWDGIRIS